MSRHDNRRVPMRVQWAGMSRGQRAGHLSMLRAMLKERRLVLRPLQERERKIHSECERLLRLIGEGENSSN